MPTTWRLLLFVAGALVAVVLFVVLRDEGDGTTTAPPPPTRADAPHPPAAPIEILVPTNTDAVRHATVPRGRRAVLVVSGAAGEEVHLHGYDIKRRIGRNGVGRIPFRATIPGRFEVELEASHRQIADLTVR